MNVGQKELNVTPYKTKIIFANLIVYCPQSPESHKTPLRDDHQLHAKMLKLHFFFFQLTLALSKISAIY